VRRNPAAFCGKRVLKIDSNEYVYVYGIGGIVAMRVNGTWFYVMRDHLGSTKLVFSNNSTVVARYEYDPYGKVVDSYLNTGSAYQFTGQELDETGIYNFRARMYDTSAVIFYAADPKHQTSSPYSYALNNPLSFTDPGGDTVVGGRDDYIKVVNDVKGKIEEKKAAIEKAKKNGDKTDKLQGELDRLTTFQSHLDAVDKSTQIYNIVTTTGGLLKESGLTEMDANTKQINIIVDLSQGGLVPLVSHELEHAWQYENHELSFNEKGQAGLLYSYPDEIDANNVQNMMTSDFSTIYNANNLAREKNVYQSLKENTPNRIKMTSDMEINWSRKNRSSQNAGNGVYQYYKGWDK
jgi:RHS repeat-associated protein